MKMLLVRFQTEHCLLHVNLQVMVKFCENTIAHEQSGRCAENCVYGVQAQPHRPCLATSLPPGTELIFLLFGGPTLGTGLPRLSYISGLHAMMSYFASTAGSCFHSP